MRGGSGYHGGVWKMRETRGVHAAGLQVFDPGQREVSGIFGGKELTSAAKCDIIFLWILRKNS